MVQTTDELTLRIDEQRSVLGYHLDELGDKVSPRRMAERRKAAMRDRVSSIKDRVMGTASAGTERAQRGSGMEGAGSHFHVIGLQDDAALLCPETLQGQDQSLEGTPGIHMGLRGRSLVGGDHRAGLKAARMRVKRRAPGPFVNGVKAADTRH